MEFVPRLVLTGVREIAVDGLGRVEIHNGRVRLTLYRTIEHESTGTTHEAVCTLVWAAVAWRESRDFFAKARDLTDEAIITQRRVARIGTH